MNIFYLHWNPTVCAQYHVDRHVVKMILETAQLLCTAIWLCTDNTQDPPYKKTHEKHPSAIWALASKENWLWLQQLGLELCKEYTHRYGKTHKTEKIIRELKVPSLPDLPFTQPTPAMPDEYKCGDSLTSYRFYYVYGKKHLHAWKKRDIPSFVKVFM